MTKTNIKSILKNEKICNTIIKRKQKIMRKKYEKISAEIVVFTQDAVCTMNGSPETISRTSMADIDDVYDFGWMSEVQ